MKYSLFKKATCNVDCIHYSMFGGKGGCGALDSWGSIHEPLEPGQICLHPNKKDVDLGLNFVISSQGLCALLEGAIIVGGENDNTELARYLTES